MFKLEFTENEVKIIGQALMEIPTKFGMPILDNIQKQVNAQLIKENTKEEAKEENV